MYNKKGLSLVVLIVTVIVMAIMTGIMVINVNVSDTKAKQVAFAEELEQIQNACDVYFLKYGRYPIDGEPLSKQDVLDLVGDDRAALEEEFTMNNDSSNSFNKIDLRKIQDLGGERGSQADENEKDIFILNETANCVYYLQGLTVANNKYFSLSPKLMDVERKANSSGNNTTFTIGNTVEAIKVENVENAGNEERDTNGWTNEISLTITTSVASGEGVYYIIANDKSLMSGQVPYTMTLNKDNLTRELLNSSGGKIYFTKEKNDTVIATTIVDISKLDIVSPQFIGEPKVSVDLANNHRIVFDCVTDDKSGVKDIYYLTSSENTTADNIIQNGTKVNRNSVSINDNIAQIKAVAVDYAGNISEIKQINLVGD